MSAAIPTQVCTTQHRSLGVSPANATMARGSVAFWRSRWSWTVVHALKRRSRTAWTGKRLSDRVRRYNAAGIGGLKSCHPPRGGAAVK